MDKHDLNIFNPIDQLYRASIDMVYSIGLETLKSLCESTGPFRRMYTTQPPATLMTLNASWSIGPMQGLDKTIFVFKHSGITLGDILNLVDVVKKDESRIEFSIQMKTDKLWGD